MHIYVYVYVHVYVCVYICICMCVYIYMYLYITCMCSLFHLAMGNEDRRVQLRALVAWRGGLFLTEGKIVVLSVSSFILTRVGVYVCVSVCIRTHTHTMHRLCAWM